MEEWKHPELSDGEVFVANLTTRVFDTCCHTTKRIGKVAYESGQPVPEGKYAVKRFPVFAQEWELAAKGVYSPK